MTSLTDNTKLSIIIDASALIALGLQETTILSVKYDKQKNRSVTFYVTRKSISEIQKFYMEKEMREDILKTWLMSLCSYLIVIDDDHIVSLISEARKRISHRDSNDWQEVALALKLGCAILTEDCDFLGTGIPTWTTDTIEHGLRQG